MEEEKQNFEQKPPEAKEIRRCCQNEKDGIFNPVKFFLGLIFIFFGLLFFAKNIGWVKIDLYFDWAVIWPFFVILIGLSMIKFRGWLGVFLGVIAIAAIFCLIIFATFSQIDLVNQSNINKETILIAKDEQIKAMTVEIKTGVGKLTIGSGAENALSGNFESNFLELEQEKKLENNLQTIVLETKGNQPRLLGKKVNNLNLRINPEIPTKLIIHAGASSIQLDLSELMIEALDINTGASSLELALGDKVSLSKIDIDAGVSSLNITLPKTVGVKLNLDAGLSSKNLNDFQKIDDNHYQSNNYDTQEKKIDFNLKLGVSSLNINWR